MNNTPEQIERFETFRTGWNRRSALLLDAAGCPRRLIKRRCPRLELPDGVKWGDLLYAMADMVEGRLWLRDDLDEFDDGVDT